MCAAASVATKRQISAPSVRCKDKWIGQRIHAGARKRDIVQRRAEGLETGFKTRRSSRTLGVTLTAGVTGSAPPPHGRGDMDLDSASDHLPDQLTAKPDDGLGVARYHQQSLDHLATPFGVFPAGGEAPPVDSASVVICRGRPMTDINR